MKVLHGLANIFLLFFILLQVRYNITVSQDMSKDLNSARLQIAIDNANKFAFSNSLQVSDLDQSYADLSSFTVDPTQVLDDFSLMMLKCYNMAETTENFALVQDYIDGAILCDNDGYYILTLQNVPYAAYSTQKYYTQQFRDNSDQVHGYFDKAADTNVETGIESPQLMWSIKYPYHIVIDGSEDPEGKEVHLAVSLTNADLVAMRGTIGTDVDYKRIDGVMDLETTEVTITHDGQTYTVDRNVYTGTYPRPWTSGSFSDSYSQDVLSDEIKLREVNILLAKQFNYSIENITSQKGRKRNYTVILPTETTRKGVNPISNSCLLIAMSQIPFAPGAEVTEPSLTGYTAVSKHYIVGYQGDDGKYYYCYDTQLPKDISSAQADKIETFNSMTEAASAGYYPALEYITRPVFWTN